MTVAAPTPRPEAGTYPARGVPWSRDAYEAFLTTLGTWLNDRGDRLVRLDERAALHATDRQRNDITIGFVVWQAIGARRDEIVAAAGTDGLVGAEVATLVWSSLLDRAGAPLAADLPEAVALVDGVVHEIVGDLDGSEAAAMAWFERQAAVRSDLEVAQRLADVLGEQVRAVATLRRELDRLAAGGGDELAAEALATLAAEAAQLRSDLEHTDADRAARLATLADARVRLDSLREREAEARAAVADAAEVVTDPPRLAVPSVDAVEVPDEGLAALPWPQARPRVVEFVDKVERVGRALDHVIEVNRAPRRERDELRGLLQAYRDKADEFGQAERPDVGEAYGAARSLLWSAPCDLAEARRRVTAYQSLVGAATGPSTAPSTDRSPEDRP